MKTNSSKSLSKFESDLAEIEIVRPSQEFVAKGRSIINEKRKETSSLKWSPFSGFVLAFSASAIFVMGVATNLLMNIEPGFKIEQSSHTSSIELKTYAHGLVASIDDGIQKVLSDNDLRLISPQVAAKQFLIANCQDCHEATYLAAFIPENVEIASELNSMMRQNILALMANTES